MPWNPLPHHPRADRRRLRIGVSAARCRALASAFICLAFVGAASSGARGHAPRPGRDGREPVGAVVDRVVRAAMARHDTPGLMIAVVDQGRVVVERGYGVKQLGSPAPPDEDTAFYIGSVSKSVTAVGAMLLVEQGKLDLDQPIERYVQGLPRPWRRIALRQFMTHTSGIPQVPKSSSFAGALARVAGAPLKFQPGSDQEYNNFNFAVTGQAIEAASGLPYLDFMRRNVFAPLHMDHTGVDLQSTDRATGYSDTPRGRRAGGPEVAAYGTPSGGLQSTVADLLKLDAALREGRLLRPATVQAMFEPTVPPGSRHAWSFTPGWLSRSGGGVQVVAKNGGVRGFHSMWQIVPSRGISVIMLWNLAGKGNDLWADTAQLLDDAFGIPKPKGSSTSSEETGQN
jgi:CubicO group peptidase (beta-lactamase class C family)